MTPPVVVPEKYLKTDVSDQAVGLDAAVEAAAKYLADNAPDLNIVRPMGVFFENTGAQPGAGRYLMDHLIADLSKDTSNVLTGKVLKVRGLTIQPAPKADGTIAAQDLEAAGSDASAYDLSGRYWLRGGAVDVRFSMKRGDGAMLSWQGKIQIADFKDLELRPVNPAVASQLAPQGAFAFQLTSSKGVHADLSAWRSAHAVPSRRAGSVRLLFLCRQQRRRVAGLAKPLQRQRPEREQVCCESPALFAGPRAR